MRKVFVSGNFNILHPGHLRLFHFAKECGQKLIVVINSDQIAGSAALVPEAMRLAGVLSNNLVDEAYIRYGSLREEILKVKPDIVVKGKEYENCQNEELDYLKSYGGKLIFSSGESSFSSSDLLRGELLDNLRNRLIHPTGYLARHGINLNSLKESMRGFMRLRVCVIGDLIIDEYKLCEPLGMSREDPTIVVSPYNIVRYLGGAGIVAAHAVGVGANVNFLTVIGNDEVGKFAKSKLKEFNINAFAFVDETRPTTLKVRYRSKGKNLLKVSYLHQESISKQIQDQIYGALLNCIQNIDLIVLSDFNYGCLTQELVDKITVLAKIHNVRLVADSQSSSQTGDVCRYKNVDLLTPTEYEARISLKNHSDGLATIAKDVLNATSSKNLILKLADDGILVQTYELQNNNSWVTDRLDALNKFPIDTAGAGDSLLIVSSLAICVGESIWAAAYLGSVAAGIQVGRLGNIPLNIEELLTEL
jgi:rfaE bifunctional protein kinase chain/domain